MLWEPLLGNGFYNAPMNWTQSYGTPRFIGQIYINYTDGTEDIIVADESWKASKSPIVMDLDLSTANTMMPVWNNPDGTRPVLMIQNGKMQFPEESPEGKMKAHMSPADKVMEQLKPVAIIKNSDGKYYVDFGQEISGWVRISVCRAMQAG